MAEFSVSRYHNHDSIHPDVMVESSKIGTWPCLLKVCGLLSDDPAGDLQVR